jgi:hypothetical protein
LLLPWQGLRDRHKAGECVPLLADPDRKTLSWTAYGHRYAEQIATDFGESSQVSNDYAIDFPSRRSMCGFE